MFVCNFVAVFTVLRSPLCQLVATSTSFHDRPTRPHQSTRSKLDQARPNQTIDVWSRWTRSLCRAGRDESMSPRLRSCRGESHNLRRRVRRSAWEADPGKPSLPLVSSCSDLDPVQPVEQLFY